MDVFQCSPRLVAMLEPTYVHKSGWGAQNSAGPEQPALHQPLKSQRCRVPSDLPAEDLDHGGFERHHPGQGKGCADAPSLPSSLSPLFPVSPMGLKRPVAGELLWATGDLGGAGAFPLDAKRLERRGVGHDEVVLPSDPHLRRGFDPDAPRRRAGGRLEQCNQTRAATLKGNQCARWHSTRMRSVAPIKKKSKHTHTQTHT